MGNWQATVSPSPAVRSLVDFDGLRRYHTMWFARCRVMALISPPDVAFLVHVDHLKTADHLDKRPRRQPAWTSDAFLTVTGLHTTQTHSAGVRPVNHTRDLINDRNTRMQRGKPGKWHRSERPLQIIQLGRPLER